MSRQNLFQIEEEEPWPRQGSSRIGGDHQYPSYSGYLHEMKSTTIDRHALAEGDGIPCSTLPWHTAATQAKLKAIGAFTNLFVTNREANIIEEELNYLKVVEAGDLDEVGEILRSCETDSEDSEAEKILNTENGTNGSLDRINTLKRKKVTSLSTESLSKRGSSDKVVEEVAELDHQQTSTEGQALAKKQLPPKRNSTYMLWQKAGGQVPLPVSLANNAPEGQKRRQKERIELNSFDKERKRKFDKNCRDQWGRSALFIAMIHHNVEMLQLLLNYQVKIDECLYHAIDFGYYDIVELFMQCETNTAKMISGEDSFYPPGLTPFQLAAHKNDYVMLKILYSHGYRYEGCKNLLFSGRKRYVASECVEWFELLGLRKFAVFWSKVMSPIILVDKLLVLRPHHFIDGPIHMVHHYFRIKSWRKIPNECKKIAFLKKGDPKKKHLLEEEKANSVLNQAWDRSNHEILYYRAISSPAYLVLTFNESLADDDDTKCDFLENIFSLYANVKRKASQEPTVRSLYQPLADQVEEFACALLSEVRSSSDLANLLRFDPPGHSHTTSSRNYLTPIQRAIEVRMKRFVAHENSQLAITALRLGTLFESEHGWSDVRKRVSLALIFPFLCIAFSFAPKSKVGKLLTNPIINMSCHITSEVIFLLMMILRLILITMVYNCDCLGMNVYTIDWIVLLWVLGRIANQIKKVRDASLRDVFLNVWMLNDWATSCLFIIVIALKIYDIVVFSSQTPSTCPFNNGYTGNSIHVDFTAEEIHACNRTSWDDSEAWPVTLSEAALALIYLLIHIRAMELLYTDRTFGPLQLSLDKMLVDTLRFLFIFSVTFLAFAFAMTQLYWAWGRPKLQRSADDFGLCKQDHDYSTDECFPVYSFISFSLLEQYWTLYGYGWGEEPPSATTIPLEKDNNPYVERGVTVIAGQAVSMVFHVWAVVVMLNMLVAMMSHSFDRVRNNAELEWKFHRSGMWMKFIRKGVYPRPPPMNLVPSTRDIKSVIRFFKHKLGKCAQPQNRCSAKREASKQAVKNENRKYRQTVESITQRYLRRYLLPDFKHDEMVPSSTRPGVPRAPSTIPDDATTSVL